MAVRITELCINCDSCIDECPATAIVSASDSPVNGDNTYVKPEKCIECSDGTVPKCADACPTEGAIVWDLPYTAEYNAYYVAGHESGIYSIREHKKNGIMFPEVSPKPYREAISIADRQAHAPVAG
ncbi:DUF362 domain-containing protein [Sulfurospirillum oryzae]|uniref:DUF362 domain-containing protein n=1 Tax=Sulfurospirillum oryzae TaxID=2976535 RepID=UPI0021E88062|nr:4Fe-4S dicluster domain-containing protein [Sulfurospirillum oryzae]